MSISAVLPYLNCLGNGFVYDDDSQILANPYIRSFHYLPQIVGSSVWSFTGTPSRYYRPLMTLGYLLCYKVFGFSPAAFHLMNIALHLSVVLLLFFLTDRIFGSRRLAFLSSAVFAVHPIHSESVAWIAAVTDLELTLFFLSTFWFFLQLEGRSGRTLWVFLLLMTGSFALALVSKEQALTLPLLATLYEHIYRRDRRETTGAQKLTRYAPLWGMAVAYIPLRMVSLGGLVVVSNFWGLTWKQLILSGISLWGQYLTKLLWPVQLCAFYVFEISNSLFDPGVLLGASAVLVAAVCFWVVWRYYQAVSFGWLWLVITLAMALNPKWLGLNVFAERYLYLPSVGFAWICGFGIERLWTLAGSGTVRRWILSAGMLVLAGLCTFRIATRNLDWRDDITLYSRTLETSPAANLIRANLARAYRFQGLIRVAEAEFRTVLEQDPKCTECLNDLAGLLVGQARFAEATTLLNRAVLLKPDSGLSHVNLGIIYQESGMTDRAQEEFRNAAEVSPKDADVQAKCGFFYQRVGDFGRAESAFERALSISPYHNEARISLAKLYEANHQESKAIDEFRVALANEPGNVEALAALRRLGN